LFIGTAISVKLWYKGNDACDYTPAGTERAGL